MTLSDLIRFFFLVNPPRIAIGFVLLVAGGIIGDLAWSMDTSVVFPCLLFLQLFACSSGYVTHGARGYYDPALTTGTTRWRVGLAHFLASAAPGILAWLVFGAWVVIRGGPDNGHAFRPASLVFLLMISAISWLLTLRLAPLSGGMLWMFVMVATALSAEFLRIVATGLRNREAFMQSPLRSVATGLLVPLISYAAPWPAVFLVAFLAITLAMVALGLLFIAKRDLPLAEEE
jgi:hypothetical protein